MEVKNIYEVAFPFLVCLTLLNKVSDSFAIDYGQIRDGRMEFGLNLEVIAISEHLRKPKKANKNMASRVRAVWIYWYPVRDFGCIL